MLSEIWLFFDILEEHIVVSLLFLAFIFLLVDVVFIDFIFVKVFEFPESVFLSISELGESLFNQDYWGHLDILVLQVVQVRNVHCVQVIAQHCIVVIQKLSQVSVHYKRFVIHSVV